MRVLVTGGSGYLGTHVRSFFDADDLSRRSGRNVLDESDCQMVADYDLVIHLAARMDKSPEAADDTFETNIEGTVNILKHVRPDAAFVFASTKDVYGHFAGNQAEVDETCPTLYGGQSPLEWSKVIAERYVEYYANNLGFRSCIFRLSTVYPPRSEGNTPNFVGHFVDAINRGEPIRLPGGGIPRRDIMHVDDLSRACKAFAGSVLRHGLYNLGGGRDKALTLTDLIAKMEAVSGLEAVVDTDNPLPDPVPMNYVTSLGLIQRELDWKPEVSLDDGLKTLF